MKVKFYVNCFAPSVAEPVYKRCAGWGPAWWPLASPDPPSLLRTIRKQYMMHFRGVQAGGLLGGRSPHLLTPHPSPHTRCISEEACALEACYVAAFRMKQRGLVMHEKLDKAAVRPFY